MKLKLPFHWSWILVLVGLWVAINQITSVVRLYKSGDRIKEAKTQLEQLETEEAQLQQKLASVDNPEYIERELRDKLGYGREGETILVLPAQNKDLEFDEVEPQEAEPNWKQWWDLYVRI